MGLVIPETESYDLSRGSFGKVPDYIIKTLDKPSIGVGSRIKGTIRLGRILIKTGAWKKVSRYYAFRNRYRLGGLGVGGGIVYTITTGSQNPQQQARSFFFGSSRRCKCGQISYYNNRCRKCRRKR